MLVTDRPIEVIMWFQVCMLFSIEQQIVIKNKERKGIKFN